MIIPGKGADPIRFGMEREAVRGAMAAAGLELSSSRDEQDFFGEENALQVEYIDGRASFIGLSGAQAFQCSIYGVDPFDMAAEDLFRLLARHDGTPEGAFNIYEHCFRNIIVTLYDADEQYDTRGRERRVMWAQMGVGDERYLDAIDKITGGAAP